MMSTSYTLLVVSWQMLKRSALVRAALSPGSLATSNYQLSTSKGFTLIETFVAVTILMTAIVGPLTLASKGLTSAMVARDQLTASFLAQEGIEYVRQKRDTNLLQGVPWLSGLSACIGADCMVDPVGDTAPVGCFGSCNWLHFDQSSNFYTYDLSDPTSNYRRTVRITPLGSGYEATIESTVEWRTTIFTRQIRFSEVVTNW